MGITPNSDVRRILIVSYHFPPDGAIGGQRWGGLSKYLARLGWEVHVVTAAPADRLPPIPGVHRHFCPRRRTFNDLYKTAAHRIRKRNGTAPIISATQSRPRLFSPMRPIAAVRRIVGSSMYFPDEGRGWVAAAAIAARTLLQKRKFSVLITSGPPHSAHFAGVFATLGQDVQHWIEMRDPWSQYESGAKNDWLVRGERSMFRLLERIMFPRASKVVVNTRQFAAALRATEPGLEVEYLPNGVDLENTPSRDEAAIERCSIAYVGTLYAGRNLSSVCAAIGRLLREQPEAAATIRLNVAGPMDPKHRDKFQEDIAAEGLSSVVNIRGTIPRTQALELLTRSHIALVLAQDQPMQVPAKIYESVGLGVPTLVIAEDSSAAATEARRIGAMTVDGSDVEGLTRLFGDMLAGRIPTSISAKAPISYGHLAQQWDALLRKSFGLQETAQSLQTAPLQPQI